MSNNFGSGLKKSLKKIMGMPLVDKKAVESIVKELQRTLLSSDVNVELVFKMSKNIKDKVLRKDLPAGITMKEQLITVLYDEIVNLVGGEGHKIQIKKPFKIMLLGLFGSGKTTTAGKIAKFFSKRGYKIALIQTDTWRPAAYEQLEQLGKKVNVPVFGDPKEKKPEKILKKFEKDLKKYDLVIVDTAGRDALDKQLTKEIKNINKKVKPNETLLVLSGDIGQQAMEQAQKFHDELKITGIIITKLDSTTKGGGALSACAVTKSPVKFIGVGERVDDLEEFEPKRFVSRLLGMGDLESLLEKAKEVMSEDVEETAKKMMSGKFDLIDLYDQLESIGKMGPLGKVMDMIPGMGKVKLPDNFMQVQEEQLKKFKHIMNSMTKKELEDPGIIGRERVERIAKGSGTNVKDVRDLLKRYKQARNVFKKFGSEKKMQKLMKRMGMRL
ncbi:MAG: signal recognition particle protein [Nanoarchaeota archaeon]|nr:signal recognition particle protein [Nanoarchaeota archaeon]